MSGVSGKIISLNRNFIDMFWRFVDRCPRADGQPETTEEILQARRD